MFWFKKQEVDPIVSIYNTMTIQELIDKYNEYKEKGCEDYETFSLIEATINIKQELMQNAKILTKEEFDILTEQEVKLNNEEKLLKKQYEEEQDKIRQKEAEEAKEQEFIKKSQELQDNIRVKKNRIQKLKEQLAKIQ